MDEIILTEQQKRCIPDVTFELIPIRNLVSNQAYQRPLSEGHIRSAVEEFDVYQINPVKVSRRDGINYVFDGQHTIEIVASFNNSRSSSVCSQTEVEISSLTICLSTQMSPSAKLKKIVEILNYR